MSENGMFLLELLVFTKSLDIRLEPKGDLYPSIWNSTQAHDLCSQTAASRLCTSELCWLPWTLPPTSPWASCQSVGRQVPALNYPWMDQQGHPTSPMQSCSTNKRFPLKSKNRYQMIWDNPLHQRVSVHTVTFSWPNASSGFQSRQHPCQLPVVPDRIGNLRLFNRIRLESSRTGWAHPWGSGQWLYQVQTSEAAIQAYSASGTLTQMCSLGSQAFDVETLALG